MGAKARTHSDDLRGPQGLLFHGRADIYKLFRSLLGSAQWCDRFRSRRTHG